MKRLLLALTAVAAVLSVNSCLDGQSTYKYTAYVGFEYSTMVDSTFFKGKTHMCDYDFYAEPLTFCRKVDADTNLLGGFAYAYLMDSLTVTETLPDPFIIFDNDSLNVGNHFMVYKQSDVASNNPSPAIDFYYKDYGTFAPQLLFIANTQLSVVRAFAEGGFGKTDWAKVTFTGYANGMKGGEVTANLFDYGVPIRTWTKVDISALGTYVDRIDIAITTSKPGIVDSFGLDLVVGEADLKY